MDDLYIFDQYNPLDENFQGGALEDAFVNPLCFAEQTLNNRSLPEIAHIVMCTLDHVLGETGNVIGYNDHKDFISNADPYENLHRMPTVLLLMMQPTHNPSDFIKDLTDITWAECFACLALFHIAWGSRHEANMVKDGSSHEDIVWEIATYYLAPAQEAATIAMMHPSSTVELITKSGLLNKVISDHKAKAGRKGGHKRDEKYRPLRQRVHDLDKEMFRHLSPPRAAREIIQSLTFEEMNNSKGRILAKYNEEITITGWIRKSRKKLQVDMI